jgi:hypothetical protein
VGDERPRQNRQTLEARSRWHRRQDVAIDRRDVIGTLPVSVRGNRNDELFRPIDQADQRVDMS